MDYVVIGGDARLAQLARLLAARGMRTGMFGQEAPQGIETVGEEALGEASNIVVNYPPTFVGTGMTFEEIRFCLPRGARTFTCGPLRSPALPGVVDLWADEALTLANARLTAEGALASAMRASQRAIRDLRCMVIGWGRIGRALTELLVGVGARVTVASRSASSRNRAVERGAESAETNRLSEALPGHGLVFNTAPKLVLDAQTLRCVDRDAMLIDLASPPYGVDLRAAWALGLRAWREPGLPGRYCPQSAAQALLDAMLRQGL